MPSSKSSHFYSDQVHVVCYQYEKQVSLYTQKEGMVYIWVGSKVERGGAELAKEVLGQLEGIGVDSMLVRRNTVHQFCCHFLISSYFLFCSAVDDCTRGKRADSASSSFQREICHPYICRTQGKLMCKASYVTPMNSIQLGQMN